MLLVCVVAIVNEHEYKTERAPIHLETYGAGPCIAVALIFQNRGFLFHTPFLHFDEDSIVEPFLDDVETFIPLDQRSSISPVIVGGSFENIFVKGLDIDDMNKMTADCRIDVQQLSLATNFGEPRIRWGRPNESQTLRCDSLNQLVYWDTNFTRPKRGHTVHHRPFKF